MEIWPQKKLKVVIIENFRVKAQGAYIYTISAVYKLGFNFRISNLLSSILHKNWQKVVENVFICQDLLEKTIHFWAASIFMQLKTDFLLDAKIIVAKFHSRRARLALNHVVSID